MRGQRQQGCIVAALHCSVQSVPELCCSCMTRKLSSPRGFISLCLGFLCMDTERALETWQGFHRWDQLAKLLKTETDRQLDRAEGFQRYG